MSFTLSIRAFYMGLMVVGIVPAEPHLDVLQIVHQGLLHEVDDHESISIRLGLKSWVYNMHFMCMTSQEQILRRGGLKGPPPHPIHIRESEGGPI